MRSAPHAQTPGDPALRARLRHVYWIGGGSGAGKSTIARRVASRHGLRVYATDDVAGRVTEALGFRARQ
jgi:predicted kinase